MNFKKWIVAALLAVPMLASAASYTFVGSWQVDQGAAWGTNPPVYSGQEAAAFLFGGSASDYAISIVDDINGITHTAWYDGWGVHSGTVQDNVFAENFHWDTGGTGYNSNPGTGNAYSAYVYDGLIGPQFTNYAYRVAAIPEPETYAMLLAGLGLMGAVARRKSKTA